MREQRRRRACKLSPSGQLHDTDIVILSYLKLSLQWDIPRGLDIAQAPIADSAVKRMRKISEKKRPRDPEACRIASVVGFLEALIRRAHIKVQ
jgi:hypothetical protein